MVLRKNNHCAGGDAQDHFLISLNCIPYFLVLQYQKKAKKCKNVKSSGVASGSNAVSYMSFVGAVITLVLNINNNINGVSFESSLHWCKSYCKVASCYLLNKSTMFISTRFIMNWSMITEFTMVFKGDN